MLVMLLFLLPLVINKEMGMKFNYNRIYYVWSGLMFNWINKVLLEITEKHEIIVVLAGGILWNIKSEFIK